jgi:hypothetical protein
MDSNLRHTVLQIPGSKSCSSAFFLAINDLLHFRVSRKPLRQALRQEMPRRHSPIRRSTTATLAEIPLGAAKPPARAHSCPHLDGEVVPALTYPIINPQPGLKTNTNYVRHIVSGLRAHEGIPSEYIDKVKAVAAANTRTSL